MRLTAQQSAVPTLASHGDASHLGLREAQAALQVHLLTSELLEAEVRPPCIPPSTYLLRGPPVERGESMSVEGRQQCRTPRRAPRKWRPSCAPRRDPCAPAVPQSWIGECELARRQRNAIELLHQDLSWRLAATEGVLTRLLVI